MDFRREPRVRSRGHVALLYDGVSVAGTVHDISESGISVLADASLPIGQALEVDCGGLVAAAVVRHCVAVDSRFRIGLELSMESG